MLNTLPVPQLGSKYTKLTNRLIKKTSYESNPNLNKKALFQTEYNAVIDNFSPHTEKRKYGIKPKTSFEQTQLEYFKQINNQMKLENLNLKQDLKICQEKLQKIT